MSYPKGGQSLLARNLPPSVRVTSASQIASESLHCMAVGAPARLTVQLAVFCLLGTQPVRGSTGNGENGAETLGARLWLEGMP